MKKIPTIFVRDFTKQPSLVTTEWNQSCEWVRDDEGIATVKYDGTCCWVTNGHLLKRREVKLGQPIPEGFLRADYDEITKKTIGWVEVDRNNPEDKYHIEAFDKQKHALEDGTYELMGPKIQGNKSKLTEHMLVKHGLQSIQYLPRNYQAIKEFLQINMIEEIVWHHKDGRMAKIKCKDFGIRW